MLFQLMFAIITPALITGAFAERAKFSTFLVFMVLWSTLVYCPVAHWVWGNGGWLRELGALDFAGGTVVHINAGVAALVAALVFGRRIGFGREPMEPHDITYVVLGAALLWFGWFGFNAGSAITAGGLAANAFVVTNTAAAAGALTWMAHELVADREAQRRGRGLRRRGRAGGHHAGLGLRGRHARRRHRRRRRLLLLHGGAAAGHAEVRRRPGRLRRPRRRRHLGRCWLPASSPSPPSAGSPAPAASSTASADQVLRQLAAIGATWGYSFVMTFGILKALDLVMGLRVSDEEELVGVDMSQHGERAYAEVLPSSMEPVMASSHAPRRRCRTLSSGSRSARRGRAIIRPDTWSPKNGGS